jgi:hypothetical protein
VLARNRNTKALGSAFAARFRESGRSAAFDRRLNILTLSGLKLRVRPIWPTEGEPGRVWRIRVDEIKRDVDFDLVVRMEDIFRPKDFFIVEPADLVVRFPHWLLDPVPEELDRFWCRSPKQLLDLLDTIRAGA